MTGRRYLLLGLPPLAVILFLGGLIWFASNLDEASAAPDATTDAIVVLTGGSQRIDRGMSLLASGKARKLFISGVGQRVDRQEVLRIAHAPPELGDCCVVLGHTADNTVGNARETSAWLASENYHSLRLVTANYHMRRAMLEFRRVLPSDIAIIADPVFPEGAQHGVLWGWRATAPVIVIEYVKYLGALIRPLLPPIRPPEPADDFESPA